MNHYQLNNEVVIRTTHLGFCLDKKLSFPDCVNAKVSKATTRIGIIVGID